MLLNSVLSNTTTTTTTTTKIMQEAIVINFEDDQSIVGNWKTAGRDLVQGFQIKKSTGLYERLQQCLDEYKIQKWMVKKKKIIRLMKILQKTIRQAITDLLLAYL